MLQGLIFCFAHVAVKHAHQHELVVAFDLGKVLDLAHACTEDRLVRVVLRDLAGVAEAILRWLVIQDSFLFTRLLQLAHLAVFVVDV